MLGDRLENAIGHQFLKVGELAPRHLRQLLTITDYHLRSIHRPASDVDHAAASHGVVAFTDDFAGVDGGSTYPAAGLTSYLCAGQRTAQRVTRGVRS